MSDHTLGRLVMEAVKVAAQMRADGASQVEANDVIEDVLRKGFPHGREWKFLCHACQDTGLKVLTCQRGARCNGISTRIDGPKETPGKYRRLCQLEPDGDYTHDYGTPCLCSLGDRFRVRPRQESDFAEAGKTSKPLTRWGR